MQAMARSNLEEELIDKAGNAMTKSINQEVLWGMLEGLGWTRVMLPRFVDNHHAIDIGYWLEENCKKAYERNGADFLFENEKDANWFKLRWGTV
jgi:hypothetical protein